MEKQTIRRFITFSSCIGKCSSSYSNIYYAQVDILSYSQIINQNSIELSRFKRLYTLLERESLLEQNHKWNLDFSCEKYRVGKLKIFAPKHPWKVEGAMPLKPVFVLSRYLNWLPRYKDSKFPYRDTNVTHWPIFFPGIVPAHFFRHWDRSVKRGASERSE